MLPTKSLLVKIDSLGTLQWIKRFGQPQCEWLYDIEPVSDGMLAAGSIEISGKNYEYVVKVANDGSLVWEYIGEYADSQFKDLMVLGDGSLAATGYSQSNIALVKLTEDGIVTFHSSYGAGIGYGFVQLENGGFIIAGNDKLVCVDADGKKAFEKDISAADSAAKSVAISASGSIVYAGYISFNGNSDALLFKISEEKASLFVSSAYALEGNKKLFNEFKETDTSTGIVDGNKLPDSYDLVDRLPSGQNIDMDIGLYIPEFKRTVDDSGKVLYEIPGSSSDATRSFAPLLPMVTKTYILPKGAIIKYVYLNNHIMELREEPSGLKTLSHINKTHGIREENFQLDNPYPLEILKWTQKECADGVYLTIFIIPIQYSYETGQVTLYKSLNINVGYSIPKTYVNITEVIVNNGTPVTNGMRSLSAKVKVNSDTDCAVDIGWVVRDMSGMVITSGSNGINLSAGLNTAAFDLDPGIWKPGIKEVTVFLKDTSVKENSLLASYFITMEVNGLNVDIEMDKRIFETSDTVMFQAEVRDERGFAITGLNKAAFSLKAENHPVPGVIVLESGYGIYSFEFPASVLSQKVQRLSLTCTDTSNAGHTGKADADIIVKTDMMPPAVTVTELQQ